MDFREFIFHLPLDPPQILSDLPTNLTVISGERFTVECKALGNPYPKLSWQLPSGQWISGGLLNISTEENKNSTGKYICLAENAHFLDVKEVFVDVIGKTMVISKFWYIFASILKSL